MTYQSQPPPYVPGQMPPNADWRPPSQPKPGRRIPPWLLGLVALVVLGTAGAVVAFSLGMKAGDEQVAAGEPGAATAPAVIRAADEYDGAQRLVGALNEAGIACLNWEKTENPLRATELGSCYVGTEQVVVAIHASYQDAAAEPAFKAGLLQGTSDVNMVIGGNWTLSCDDADLCMRIARDFGGTFKNIPA